MVGGIQYVDLSSERPVILCLSHLRWGFVFQRPQHLMSRLAHKNDVLYWEEPIFAPADATAVVERRAEGPGLTVLTPVLPEGLDGQAQETELARLLEAEMAELVPPATQVIRWFYTPMMLGIARSIEAQCTVYDCMDELANFDSAPSDIKARERELLSIADLVFTGGQSLYEAKVGLHPHVFAFPSSVDTAHFAKARQPLPEPEDQRGLPGPKLGYVGVIDERFDRELLREVAVAHPEWSLVMVGPVVKIDPETLPRAANISYLGGKDYSELPAYLAHWDVALMPFAINAATKYISPTKTPEYLAAGCPVVSTPIYDVVRQYGKLQGVAIAGTSAEFIAACEQMLLLDRGANASWRVEVDMALSQMSWDNVVSEMTKLIHETVASHGAKDLYFDYLVVGAGFAGSVMAERLARGANKKVLVVDRRPHIAGNAFDRHDEAGILMHQYGPHIFHTNSHDIVDYLSQFTKWRPYEHRVLAQVDDHLVPVPINRTTLNAVYDVELKTPEEAQAFLSELAEPVETIRTSEDVVVSQVGRNLYNKMFRGYTRKQWGLDPSELDKSVTARIPTRTDTDDRYFTDTFQAMPADGYTAMFENMLTHENISVALGVDYRTAQDRVSFGHLVFTGPIDEFFEHCYGPLPYRSLEFRHETVETERFQAVATVNYPSEDVPYTRITEFKHLTGQEAKVTSVTYEYPRAEGDPYYPIPRPENAALFKRYEALAIGTPNVTFVGRLATYRYYNMDQVVGQALTAYRRHVGRVSEDSPSNGSILLSGPTNANVSARKTGQSTKTSERS